MKQIDEESVSKRVRNVSREDVAKLAGVSHMTVTRVLQNHPQVKEETRLKVQNACEALNYRYNLLASYLSTKRSYALGVVCPKLEHIFFARLIKAVESAATEFGYHIIVSEIEDDCSVEDKRNKLGFLLERQVDGLIISTPMGETPYSILEGEDIPIILLEHKIEGFSYIGTDDIAGATEAVRYLIELGHRDIAHLAGPIGSYSGDQRLQGYRQALEGNGLPCLPDLVVPTDYDLSGGYQGAKELLEKSIDITAIFAANDYVAVGAISALSESGLRVPEDISIVGFSGDKIGEYSVPTLTTIYQPVEQIGRSAVGLVMKQIESSKNESATLIFPNRLVERRSCRRI